MSINTQDANDTAVIALSAAMSWVASKSIWIAANILQIIPVLVAVVSLIFMIKRHYQDKKKRDIENQLNLLQIEEIKRLRNNESSVQDIQS